MSGPLLPTPTIHPAVRPLPPWNRLAQDRRQKSTTTLAAMIRKQLLLRSIGPWEIRDERPQDPAPTWIFHKRQGAGRTDTASGFCLPQSASGN